MYKASNDELEKKEKALKNQHSNDLHKVRKAAVTTVSNMILMHTFIDSNLQVREELEEGINYFKDLHNRITMHNV